MALKGILFDKDGTLLDFYKTWMPSIRAMAAYFGDGREDRSLALMELAGYDAASGRILSGSVLAAGDAISLAECWAPAMPEYWRDVEVMVPMIDAFYTEAVEPQPVCDLAAFGDALLARNVVLGIATSDSERGIEVTLKHTGFLEKVSFTAGYDSGHGRKPGPGMALAFCEALDLDPATIMVVGDNTHDMEMGRSAGAGVTVGVLTGTSTRAEIEAHADHVLESVEDLPALLGRL